MRTLPLKYNISNNTPEIFPVGTERMLQIGFKITPLAVLNLIKGFRHIQIIWREQPRFSFCSKLLQISFIQTKILLAQWSNSHKFHLSLENVSNHGKFINPHFAEQTSPLRNAIVIGKLAANIQVVVLVNIGLEEL